MLGFFLVVSTIVLILLLGAFAITRSTPVPKWRRKGSPLHLLVVLGSGGHTAEIFTMLYRMDLCPSKYAYRTYLVSSGDNFSAAKAVEYEIALRERGAAPASYVIVTVPRARRVHQSYFTAPFSTLLCFRSCFLALCRRHPDQRRHGLPEQLTSPYPDLILTNGPATAVCAVLAARILRLCHGRLSLLFPGMADAHPSTTGAEPDGSNPMVDELRLRTIFVESWARVKTLSLSGKILLPFADRFLVQWPALEGKRVWWGMKRAQYVPGLMG
ncbi:oligosaccharide biosynthesis protein Alg14-like protein [Aspergillus varians]